MSDLTEKTAQAIERAQTEIHDGALKIGISLVTLSGHCAVCKASPALSQSSDTAVRLFLSIDENLKTAVTGAYALAGSKKKGKLTNPRFSTACGAAWRDGLQIDTAGIDGELKKIKAQAVVLEMARISLGNAERAVRAVRSMEQDLSSISGIEALAGSMINKLMLVDVFRDKAADALRRAGADLKRILTWLNLICSAYAALRTQFSAAEEQARMTQFEDRMEKSRAIQTKQQAREKGKQTVKDLKAMQAEYVALYGVESETIKAEIARIRQLRIDAAIEAGLGKLGMGGDWCKDWFYKTYGGIDPAKRDFAWCDRFASWMLVQMGYEMKAGGCPAQMKEFKKRGGLHQEADYRPKTGDVVFFDWGKGKAQHVGIIHVADDGEIYVLQGNYNSQVSYVKLSKILEIKKGEEGKVKRVIGYGDPTCLKENR
ncbi:MAG: CHAP domain-containing protein [Lachnospiraceae bacterium]|nr:CHAP domain-containing protein [Lachnospiraceae bacterium]